MNSDGSPSPAARPSSWIDDEEDGGGGNGDSNSSPQHVPSAALPADGVSARSTRRRRRRRKNGRPKPKPDPGFVKKLDFMTHLLKNLDMFIYAELAALYYMECSAVRFFIRAWCQQNFLSPKPPDWPIPLPPIQAQILSVFLPTTLCILSHLFGSVPTAGEAARGYMHGGIVVDFIGQKPPSSRLTLLALDMVILALQCLMLSVHSERERLRSMMRPQRGVRTPSHTTDAEGATATTTYQSQDTHDALTSREFQATDAGGNVDIEMRNLGNSEIGPGDDDDDENEDDRRPLLDESSTSSPRTSLLDVMNSGNGMIPDFYVVHTIRSATPDFWGTLGHGLQSVGYQATLARLRARVARPTWPQNQGQV